MLNKIYEWPYKDTNNDIIGKVVRYQNTETNKKEVKPYFNDNFKAGIPDEIKDNRPLFGLDNLTDDKDIIFIVEGEKSAQALQTFLNRPCITSLGGSQSANKSNWEAINNYNHYVMLPDNDDAGNLYMHDIYKILKKNNSTSKFTVLKLPELREKEDICDWIKKKFSSWDEYKPVNEFLSMNDLEILRKEFYGILREQKNKLPTSWSCLTGKKGLKCISFNNFLNSDTPVREPLLYPWITESSLNMVFAERGVGKTYFALNCAYAIASGNDFLNYRTQNKANVLYIDGEMQSHLMINRLKQISNNDFGELPFQIITPDILENTMMPDLSTKEGQEEFNEIIDMVNAKVIFIDNLSTLCRTGRENEGESWLSIQSWAIYHRSKGRAVVFIHHANKGGEQRGSSRKEDVLDNIICLKRPDDYDEGIDGEKFEIHFTKARSLLAENTRTITASFKDDVWQWETLKSKKERAVEFLRDGLKQQEVAEILGVNKSTICRWNKVA